MTGHRTSRWAGLVGILATALVAPRPIQTSGSDATLRGGTLSFVGHATTGDFVGATSQATGTVTGTPDLSTVSGWVEAPVSTLRTGNGLRDRDLLGAVDAKRYPTMRFDVARITARTALGTDSVPAVLHGTFRLHGVTRPMDVPVTIARIADTVRVAGGFPLDVSAYGVHGLTRMFGLLRVREIVDVHLALRFTILDARADLSPGTRP